jgi:tetratricopeptide (TPR) repeat protein
MYAISYRVGILYSPESESHALEYAERAMQLDSMNSTVLGYTGCALADIGQVQRALPILRHAVELNPVNAQAWSALGSACMLDKNVEEAIRHLRHGMEISPLNKWLSLWGPLLSLCLMVADDLEGADDEALLACQRDDRLYLPRVVLSGIRLRSRNRQGARAALDEARRIKPDLSAREVKFLLGNTLGTLASRTSGL